MFKKWAKHKVKSYIYCVNQLLREKCHKKMKKWTLESLASLVIGETITTWGKMFKRKHKSALFYVANLGTAKEIVEICLKLYYSFFYNPLRTSVDQIFHEIFTYFLVMNNSVKFFYFKNFIDKFLLYHTSLSKIYIIYSIFPISVHFPIVSKYF